MYARVGAVAEVGGRCTLEKSASPRCRSTPNVGWTQYYNERRFHESLDHLTPKDVYLGQGKDKRNNKAKFNQQKNFWQWNIRVNNYICSSALLFDNVQSIGEQKKNSI